jgi:hypothetical protein
MVVRGITGGILEPCHESASVRPARWLLVVHVYTQTSLRQRQKDEATASARKRSFLHTRMSEYTQMYTCSILAHAYI